MTSDATSSAPSNAPAASRRWRSLWRVHFYAGIFAAPVLVMFALTGLVILYTQPVLSVSQSHLRNVTAQGAPKPYDEQLAAVQKAFPDAAVSSVVVPRNASSSTEFGLDTGRSAFVNPYTAEVLGTTDPGGGIVGLSNRLHGVFNNDSVKVKLPTIAGLLGSGAVMQSFVVGDMILEVFACWAIVLVLSGLYLYWPRRSRAAGGRVAKPWVTPRLGKKGRARWRDLHAIPGMLTALGTLFVLTTGLFWSSYWAAGYTALANKITPNNWIDAPNSSIAKIGDLDRLKNNINWNTSGQPIPNSGEPASGAAALPARISLDTIVAAAAQEHMKPGYSISFPIDGKDDAGNPTFGSFTLANSWPRKTSEAKTVYLDQFSGATIATMDIYGNGSVSIASDTLVSTHMGTQIGLLTRIVMTLLCLSLLWSVASSIVMYTKRRRPGTLALPRRPADVRLAKGLLVLLVVVGLVYPLWGVTALLVLSFDRFVIRRTPRLRAAFGQR